MQICGFAAGVRFYLRWGIEPDVPRDDATYVGGFRRGTERGKCGYINDERAQQTSPIATGFVFGVIECWAFPSNDRMIR